MVFRRQKRFKKRGHPSRMKKTIKRMINQRVSMPELKAVALNHAAIGALDSTTGTFKFPFLTAGPGNSWSIGAAANQRIGTEIYLKKIEFRWTDFVAANLEGGCYRAIVVIDTEGAVYPASMFGTLEAFFNATAIAGQSINSSYNLDTVGKNNRFHVLHDQLYVNNTNYGSAADTGMHARKFTYTFPFKGMKVLFRPDDPAAGTEIAQKNNVFIWFVRGGIPGISINEMRSCCYYTDA